MSVAPVLKTSICKSDVSTSSRFRFYVKRKLNVKGNVDMPRLALHSIFQSLCDHELEYQELSSDLALSLFCRTGVVDTSVILEADCLCYTFQERIETLTLTDQDMVKAGQYLSTLHRKTNFCNNSSVKKLVSTKFQCKEKQDIIIKCVFEEPLLKLQNLICPQMKKFGEKSFLRAIETLSTTFHSHNKCVVHANFTTNNVVLKQATRYGTVITIGSELSHLGNPVYDVGSFLGDLFIWYYLHQANSDGSPERKQFCQKLPNYMNEFMSTYLDRFDLFTDDDTFAGKVIRTAAGFAGVSMLFRTLGDDWNDSLPVMGSCARAEILGCAYRLISNFETIESSCQLVNVGLKLA